MERRPNFFIVGAPKCGTTALWEYLRHHPNVFFPTIKEPHFFAGDLRDSARGFEYRETLEGYLWLFRSCSEKHSAIGEASVWYLYAPGSLERIQRFNPSAKVIAMVRSPIEMFASLHAHYFRSLHEDQEDLWTAWCLQDDRLAGLSLPRGTTDPRLFQYRSICELGRQVDQLLQIFPRRQVKVVVFDDFVSDPRATYEEVLAFLGLTSDGRTLFPRINEHRALRSRRLARANQKIPSWSWVRRLKRSLGLPHFKLVRIPEALIYSRSSRPRVPDSTRERLVPSFVDDVARLGQVLDRDLTCWVSSELSSMGSLEKV